MSAHRSSSLIPSFIALFVLCAILFLVQHLTLLPHLNQFRGSESLSIPARAYYEIAIAIGIHFSLWLLIATTVIIIASVITQFLSLREEKLFPFTIYLWLLVVIWIFSANAHYFRLSAFSDFLSTVLTTPLVTSLFFLSSLLLAVICILFIVALLTRAMHHKSALLVIVLFCIAGLAWQLQVAKSKTFAKPNIFIIGIDSLRPDYIGFFNPQHALTPHLDVFLQNATSFTDNLSPLARTYPAWVSILTGRYPLQNDLIENLQQQAKLTPSIASVLQQHGYRTVYATDETRFSYIDHALGFFDVIGPKMGVNNFLFGRLFDFPLCNLLINTRIGPFLFPFNAINRSAVTTYKPHNFSDFLSRYLNQTFSSPLFFAVHFCMPHFNYIDANTPPNVVLNMDRHLALLTYQHAVQQADKQVGQFLQDLQQHDLLKNAIVIVLSDHGDALNLSGDRILTMQGYQSDNSSVSRFAQLNEKHFIYKELDKTSGHGTDVLSPSQFHTLLAMRVYAEKTNIATRYNFPTSLLDIKPTLENFLAIQDRDNSGMSLKPYLFTKLTAPHDRDLFMESGFTPKEFFNDEFFNSSANEHDRTAAILAIAKKYYAVDAKSTMVYLKPTALTRLIADKQYAVIKGPWLLALYPFANRHYPVIVNRQSKQWSDDLQSSFAKRSPATQMLRDLQSFYQNRLFPVEGRS